MQISPFSTEKEIPFNTSVLVSAFLKLFFNYVISKNIDIPISCSSIAVFYYKSLDTTNKTAFIIHQNP